MFDILFQVNFKTYYFNSSKKRKEKKKRTYYLKLKYNPVVIEKNNIAFISARFLISFLNQEYT